MTDTNLSKSDDEYGPKYGTTNNDEKQLAMAPAQVEINSANSPNISVTKFIPGNEPLKKALKVYEAVGGPHLTKLDSKNCCGMKCACTEDQVEPIARDFPGYTTVQKKCCFCETASILKGCSCCSGDHNFMLDMAVSADRAELKPYFRDDGTPVPGFRVHDAWKIELIYCVPLCCYQVVSSGVTF